MLLNSLAALALGFALDMLFGDPDVIIYPQKLVKALIKTLARAFKHSYKRSDDAQQMGGVMLVVAVIVIVGGLSAILLVICYSVNNLLGIVFEGILCWSAVSVRGQRLSAESITRAVKGDNLARARKRLSEVSYRDTDELDMQGVIKGTIETVAEDSSDKAVSPLFWCAIFGGAGGFLVRTLNILDSTIGFKSADYRFFGKAAAIVDDILVFIPARLCAMFMLLDSAFLGLSVKDAWKVYRKDKRHSPSPNAAQTQSVCAGAMELTLGGDIVRKGEVIKRPTIGNGKKEATSNDIFWTTQMMMSASAMTVFLAAVVRLIIHFV
ncbi:MAG: cobalamin biosynthesis protein CobD [Ruminococcus sp.]|nr:cobalamin biosynthesis protein CobD [Ruminococcus sp.]